MPCVHQFEYPVFLLGLDLDEIEPLFAGRWLSSATRPAPAWFRRADHLGDPKLPLADAVRALLRERLGREVPGRIQLLTQLRWWGFLMNPVSFYFCGGEAARPDALVAEVTNTPWREQHCYAFDWPRDADGPARFSNGKAFHVSPFMGMDSEYRWVVSPPGNRLELRIDAWRERKLLFESSLDLVRSPLTTSVISRCLLRHPWVSAQIGAAIYWQALKLWWKGAPFHPHPNSMPAGAASVAGVLTSPPERTP
ncbi:MAG: DUF1365 domain-containing protein [Planctomyces sp.]|nr:DUF1365 domain-containing protein [Planctomyces sp.]